MTRTRPDVEIHVERLVLHGVTPGQRHTVADRVIASLEPLLAERGLGAWAVDGAEIDQLTTTAEPGQPIGHAIASTLTPPERT